MYQEERLLAILQYLQKHKRISVQDICELFDVSRDTARRDIVKLEEQGSILRTRGGAILPSLTKTVNTYHERLQMKPGNKRSIGAVAAGLIKDGDYIIMDASTTVQFAAQSMSSRENLVVTNSIDIAGILADHEGVSVNLLGGRLQNRHRYVYGSRTIEMLSDYQVDKLLLGACAISSGGLTIDHEEEGFLLREMIKRADQIIVLADHSKFGRIMFHRVAGLDKIDILITDSMPDGVLDAALRKHEVEVIVVPVEDP